MIRFPSIQTTVLKAGSNPAQVLPVAAAVCAAAVVDQVLVADHSLAIIVIIPLLVAVFASSTWLVALTAGLAILDFWLDARDRAPSLLVSHAIVFVVLGTLGILLVRQRRDSMALHGSLEQQVADRTRELTNLLAASHALASTLDLDDLLRLILDRLNLIIDCTTTHLFTRVGDELVLFDYRGPPRETRAPPAPIALGRAEVRETLVERRGPIVVEDIRGDSEAARRFRRAFGEHVANDGIGGRSRMWITLLVRGEVVGGLCLSNAAPGYFTERHESLARAFASEAATALHNAKLYEEAKLLAAMQERQRLARDLHDAVTQTLFAGSLIAEVLPRLWERDQDEGRRSLESLEGIMRGALAEMRTLLTELRPSGIGALPLDELVHQLAEGIANRAQVRLSFEADNDLPPLPEEVHTALYRIAQEALYNVARHARASLITAQVWGGPRAVEVVIRDDGQGFDPASVPGGHLGLAIMRERATSIGATLEIQSQTGQGTHVRVVWPVPTNASPRDGSPGSSESRSAATALATRGSVDLS